jgi:hypothetical protein
MSENDTRVCDILQMQQKFYSYYLPKGWNKIQRFQATKAFRQDLISFPVKEILHYFPAIARNIESYCIF